MDVAAVAKRTPAEVLKFLVHLAAMAKSIGSASSDFAFSVRVDFNLVKTKSIGAVTATIVGEGGDLKVHLDEDKVPPQFSLTYEKLSKLLVARYADFKQNEKYHKLRRELEKNKSYCYVRRLDPSNSKSPKTRFYNGNIVQQFDKHYTRKASAKPETEAKSVFA
jgi:hypothetical protein